MKTPEEMAKEYAVGITSILRMTHLIQDGFLAGHRSRDAEFAVLIEALGEAADWADKDDTNGEAGRIAREALARVRGENK